MSVSTMPSRAETVRLQHRKRVILTVILISVGIHVIVGIVAGIVIVAPSRRPNSRSPRTSGSRPRSASTR